LAETQPGKFETNTLAYIRIIHISFYIFILRLVKLAIHQNAHCDVGRFPFILSSNRNLAISLKAHLNLLHSNFEQKIYEFIFSSAKPSNLYKFSIKMRTSVISSGLHGVNEVVDHVVWTAARLCDNWWMRVQARSDNMNVT